MKKIFIVLFICISCFIIESCVNVPENPIYITVINKTEESILVTNLSIAIQVGMSNTTTIEKGSTAKVTGVNTGRKYGSRVFYFDTEWEIR
jgi:regulatory protein YycI of two-component signal transduction system YycFG